MSGKYEKIEIFAAVASHGSFVAAARTLNQSAPVVTRVVSELEADLGVQLFVRTTRKVSLTQAGRQFLDRAKLILVDMENAEQLVKSEERSLSGELRINAPMSLGVRLVPAVVAEFHAKHKDVTLRIDLTDQLIDIVSAGYDMALRISAHPTDKSTIWRKLAEVRHVLVASPTYLKKHGVPKHAADLKYHECLGYANASQPIWRLRNSTEKGQAQVITKFCFACNNGDILGELVSKGAGIALLPTFIANKLVTSGKLVHILPDWRNTSQYWLTAYYPPYKRLPAKVAAFSQIVEQALAQDKTLF